MKLIKTILLTGLPLAAMNAQAEVYKCPGAKGPIFTSTPGEGCEVQTVNPPMPSDADVTAAIAARNNRLAKEREAREAELERQKTLEKAAAERRERDAREQARRAQDAATKAQEDENELLRMLRGPIP